MELLTESLITSLSIIGLYYATSYELDSEGEPTEKNILWFIRYGVDKYLGEWIGKPLILCPQCMASVYGIIFYFGVFAHPISSVVGCVVFILIVSALNKLIVLTIER